MTSTSRYTDPATYAATRLPVEQATTLIPDAYRCEEFFRIEQERVWSRSWVAVGYVCQIPNVGDTLLVEVAGQSLIVVRNRSGEFRCFHNVCRHRGSRRRSEVVPQVLRTCQQRHNRTARDCERPP